MNDKLTPTYEVMENGKRNKLIPVARNVVCMQIVFVNVYFVGAPGGGDGSWTLIDTGLPGFAWRIKRAAEHRFSQGARPNAIILTHGHFDHASSARELADEWGVPIYAHRLEMPYLTGESDYPPQDPTVGGALAQMSRLFPHSGFDFGSRVQTLPEDGSVPGLPGWRWLHTPGHTAGHISLFRESDGLLIAGDALATLNQENVVTLMTQKPELRQPPAPFTTDWGASKNSIAKLAELQPAVIAAGHGLPVTGLDTAEELRRFSQNFTPPPHGRYVGQPAETDEHGVVAVPPPAPDPVRNIMIGAALTAGAAIAITTLARRRR